MAEAATVQHRHEINSPDGSISIRTTHTPGYLNQFTVDERWPASMEEEGVFKALMIANEAVGSEPDAGQAAWLNTVSPYFIAKDVMRPSPFRGFIDGLGFSLGVDTEQIDGQTVNQKRFTYPSIDRFNDFMDAAFGQAGVRFAPYAGGEYSPLEFMEKFVETGEVLIATEQPYELHDLSDHAFGWAGIPDKLLETLRQRLGAYVSRYHGELELPAVPGMANGSDYLFPSGKVLNLAMEQLDRQTSNLFEEAMFGHDSSRVRCVRDTLECFFRLQSREPLVSIPQGLLGESPRVSGEETLDRYQRADEIGRQMLAGRA